eukprot:12371814-Alexandrium_andersonii.AAC.1
MGDLATPQERVVVAGPADLRGAILCPIRLSAAPWAVAQGPSGPPTAPVRVALLAGAVALAGVAPAVATAVVRDMGCLLYTSDAADDM